MSNVSKVNNQVATTFDVPDDYDLGIAREDVKIPSVILWQKISDMAEFEGEDVKAGEFVNPVTVDNYGTSFEGAVIKYFVSARVFGDIDKDTGRKELLKYSREARLCEDGTPIQPSEFQWKDDGSHALKSYHYLVLIKGVDMPALLTFKGASAKFAKSLNANLMYTRPSWRSWFKFTSKVEDGEKGKYYVIQAKAQPKKQLDQNSANACLGYYSSITSDTMTSPEMEKSVEPAKPKSEPLEDIISGADTQEEIPF